MPRPATATAAAVSIEEAAEQLGVHAATVRRWVQAGAPTVELGSVGRGHGSLVDLQQLRRWRAARGAAAEQEGGIALQALGALLLDFHRRDSSGCGKPAHRALRMHDRDAAALYVSLYAYLHARTHGSEPDDLPTEVQALAEIARGMRD